MWIASDIVTTAPTARAIELSRVQEHVIACNPEEGQIAKLEALILVAEELLLNHFGIALIQQSRRIVAECFPPLTDLRPNREFYEFRYPASAIDSLTYVDTDGNSQTLASSKYQSDFDSYPNRLAPAYNESWPSVRAQYASVQVNYTAGFGTAETDIPERFKRGMENIIYHMWHNGTDCPPCLLETVGQIVMIDEPYSALATL